MKPRICICCGEPIPVQRASLSRNPNMCASCSSLADAMGEWGVEDLLHPALWPQIEQADRGPLGRVERDHAGASAAAEGNARR